MTCRPKTAPRGRRGPVGPTGPSGPETGRFGTACLTVTNWNDAVTNGYYMAFNGLNAPVPNQWFMGHIIAHDTGYVEQIIHAFTSQSVNDNKKYRRWSFNGNWSAWKRDYNTDVVAGVCNTAELGNTNFAALDRFGFASIALNTNGLVLGAGGRVVVPRAGLYELSLSVFKVAGTAANLYVDVNDILRAVMFLRSSANDSIIGKSIMLNLSSNDNFSIRAADPCTLRLGSNSTTVNIKLIG